MQQHRMPSSHPRVQPPTHSSMHSDLRTWSNICTQGAAPHLGLICMLSEVDEAPAARSCGGSCQEADRCCPAAAVQLQQLQQRQADGDDQVLPRQQVCVPAARVGCCSCGCRHLHQGVHGLQVLGSCFGTSAGHEQHQASCCGRVCLLPATANSKLMRYWWW